jgi:alginate O-acetyltransferase complex protein AlgI
MTLAGLWHGAGWNYVLWGVTQGVLLIVHRVFRAWCERRPTLRDAMASTTGTALRIAFTFTTFIPTWVIFRSTSLGAMGTMLRRMFWPAAGADLTLVPMGLYATFALVAAGHALGDPLRAVRLWERLPRPVRGLAFGSAAALALVIAPPVDRAFLYFQF